MTPPRKGRLSGAQRDFAARVNHTLRGDLNALRQALELARESLASGNRNDPLAEMERAVARIERRALDIALLTQADAGTLTHDLNRQPTSLRATIAEAIQAAQPLATMYDVELAADLGACDTVEANLDGALIARALGALIENAIRYTREGGRVTVSAELGGESGALARITITDQGPGFPPSATDRLLAPFAVGDRSGRLGLGLAVARAILEAHGGQLRLTNSGERGSGAIVIAELPLESSR